MSTERILAAFGILFILLVCWIFSENKKAFPTRVVIWGLIIQFTLAVFVLNIPFGVDFFSWLGDRISEFLDFSRSGAIFLFSNIADPENFATFGFQFAIIVTSVIIFFSSFVSVLYHYNIIQRVVKVFAWGMQKTMGTSGIESLSASANIFIGQTEAPLLIRHYLKDASRSELNSIMTVGFATIAGSVFAAYVAMGIEPQHLITAAVISAPGGLMLSKIVIPQTKKTRTLAELDEISIPKNENVLVALTNGAADGLKLALNIMAMLIAFIAIIALLDAGMGLISGTLSGIGIGWFPDSLNELLGYIFLPFAYLTGVPAEEARIFASLFGTKISVNEFLAFADLGELIKSGAISERTATISTFALCGFANLSSIAIQIGGLGALVPEKKAEIASLGFKAMITASFANLLTATIAGLLL